MSGGGNEEKHQRLRDPIIRLGYDGDVPHRSRDKNFDIGVVKFKRGVIGICNDEPKYYHESDLTKRMTKMGMFDTEEEAKKWLEEACPIEFYYPKRGNDLYINFSRGPRGEKGYEVYMY